MRSADCHNTHLERPFFTLRTNKKKKQAKRARFDADDMDVDEYEA